MITAWSELRLDWSDRPCYIIGGGPSLSGFDFSRLPAGRRVGANKAAWRADCEVMVSLDQNFVRHHREDIAAYVREGGTAILAMPTNEAGHEQIPGAIYLVRRRNPGLSRDPRDLYGVNSGYAALGAAYLCGAREIALLGFDMQYSRDGASHFHEGYAWHNRNSHKFYDKWSTAFEDAAAQFAEAGACVTNFVGLGGSKVTAFPTRPLADLI